MYAATKKWSKVLCIDMERSPRYIVYGGKKLQNVGERLTSFVSLSTHTYTDTQTCARTDVRTHTHTHPLTHTSHYAPFKDEETEGLPWWFSGEDSLLLMQGARVRSLVRELDPVW